MAGVCVQSIWTAVRTSEEVSTRRAGLAQLRDGMTEGSPLRVEAQQQTEKERANIARAAPTVPGFSFESPIGDAQNTDFRRCQKINSLFFGRHSSSADANRQIYLGDFEL
jgi:hypothetical protein